MVLMYSLLAGETKLIEVDAAITLKPLKRGIKVLYQPQEALTKADA